MLEIKNFSHSYDGQKKACENISIVIEDGDIYGFIGHNGAGKSTTLKSCVGIIDFSEGEININGLSIKRNPIECKNQIAYIPDNPNLYEGLTGIKYLNFICDVYQVNENRLEKIEKYSEEFGIKDALANQIKSYSHGMKQKLALIGALVHEPRVLIMDEPFVGLDPTASFKIKEIMKDLASKGCSIFFSSHVLEVVEKLCNKIAIIKDGKIVKQGLTEDVTKDSSLENIFIGLTDNNDAIKEV